MNARTFPEAYPLPNLKSFTNELHGSKVFSKIDLVHAFHNVLIHPDDVEKTATVTPWGVYVYKRLAFGLSGGPSTFMKLIDSVLAGIDGIFAYLDDFLIHAPDEKTHYDILKQVFTRLKENGLAIRLDKCEFGKKSVEFLGYHVSNQGILPLKRKVSAIVDMKPPTTQKDLLNFLGALGYYRSSLKGIKEDGVYQNPAEVMQVLFNLATCKLPPKTKLPEIWNQNSKIKNAFEKSKQMLVNAVMLTHPNPDAKLALCTDSSDYAIGGALEQVGSDGKFHPLAFFSKHLGPDKQKWSTFRKELYAIVQSLRHFIPDFYGRHITIYSDHLPITKSFESNTLQSNDPVAQRQLVEIGMFTKDVKYLPGKQNHIADYLSRKTPEALIGEAYKIEKVKEECVAKGEEVDYSKIKVSAASESVKIESLPLVQLKEAQETCKDVENCLKGQHSTALTFDYVDIDGFTLFCETSGERARPLVPKSHRKQLIELYHSIDHAGQAESVRRAAEQYFWPTLKKDIIERAKTCHACLSTKPSKMKAPHIGHFPVPQRRFSHIQVDICGPLPPSKGYKYLLSVICRSTRYVDAIPMKDATTESCADALLHSWVARHGVASACTSDNGVEFVSALWRAMQKKLGIELHYTPLYTPQANGLLERQHQTIKTSLKASLIQMGDKYGENWYDYLPWILLMKRVAFQKELKASPSMLTYGMNVAVPGDLLRNPDDAFTEPELEELVKHLNKTDSSPPKPTGIPPQVEVPEPPESITHVYTWQHNKKGLEAPYAGPFAVVSRPTRSTVKIKVGLTKAGEERYEIRSWKDLKVAHMAPEAEEAQRPKRGRPSRHASVPSDDQNKTSSGTANLDSAFEKEGATVNKAVERADAELENSNVGAKPKRSTRNPNPIYVDGVSFTGPPSTKPFKSPHMWSASPDELKIINDSIQTGG